MTKWFEEQREIERLRAALLTALVAMRIASRLPGVNAEYDFEPAIAEVTGILEQSMGGRKQ